jgi:hypothetical protein
MANGAARLVMKGFSIAVGIPVGIATKRLVDEVWSMARPSNPPRKPNETGVIWRDAISWAALSAVGIVVADLVTRKGAEEVWRTLLGTEPPEPKDTKAQRKLAAAQAEVEIG